MYTAGIKLFMHLHVAQGWAESSAVGVCLVACLLIVIVIGELFYRLVDIPSQLFAKGTFDWIRT
jgi:heme/copper-type cytochrome/quinol oxidase subunit 4